MVFHFVSEEQSMTSKRVRLPLGKNAFLRGGSPLRIGLGYFPSDGTTTTGLTKALTYSSQHEAEQLLVMLTEKDAYADMCYQPFLRQFTSDTTIELVNVMKPEANQHEGIHFLFVCYYVPGEQEVMDATKHRPPSERIDPSRPWDIHSFRISTQICVNQVWIMMRSPTCFPDRFLAQRQLVVDNPQKLSTGFYAFKSNLGAIRNGLLNPNPMEAMMVESTQIPCILFVEMLETEKSIEKVFVGNVPHYLQTGAVHSLEPYAHLPFFSRLKPFLVVILCYWHDIDFTAMYRCLLQGEAYRQASKSPSLFSLLMKWIFGWTQFVRRPPSSNR